MSRYQQYQRRHARDAHYQTWRGWAKVMSPAERDVYGSLLSAAVERADAAGWMMATPRYLAELGLDRAAGDELLAGLAARELVQLDYRESPSGNTLRYVRLCLTELDRQIAAASGPYMPRRSQRPAADDGPGTLSHLAAAAKGRTRR